MNGDTQDPNFLQDLNQNEMQLKRTITGISINKNYNQNQFNTSQTPQIQDISINESLFMFNNGKIFVNRINNKGISFYSIFKFLKFKYEIKNSRRNQIDCLIKRVKTKFHNSLHLALKNCLNIYINRLPQFFISNVKIDFNKLNLDKTIDEIYSEYKILPSLEEIMEKKIYRKGQKEFVKVLMSSKLKNVYKAYLLSQLYKNHINYIQIKEGTNFAKVYNFVSKYVLDYYLNNKGNKKKQTEKEKISENNVKDINNNVNNNTVENAITDNKINHNLKSISTTNVNKMTNFAKNGKLFLIKKY